jgi:hypothetical protein
VLKISCIILQLILQNYATSKQNKAMLVKSVALYADFFSKCAKYYKRTLQNIAKHHTQP